MERSLRVAAVITGMILAAAYPGETRATPARVNALDGGNFLVPDDWDIANYYSLAPEFANHLYFYYPLSRKPYGWGNFEVKPVGTFVIWLNLPNPTAPIFAAVPALSSLGYLNKDLDVPVAGVKDWDPKDNRIATPDLKLGLGWGRRFGDALSIGLCSRYADTDETDEDRETGGVIGMLSPAAYVSAYQLFTTSVTGFSQHQRSSTFALGPSASWKGEAFSVDIYAAWIALGVDNSWEATLDDGAGNTGNLKRSLAFDGSSSLQGRLKLMVPLTERATFAFSTQVTSLDLSTQHTTRGSFAGAGLTSQQQGGVNLADATETLTAAPWTGMAGVFMRTNEYVVVVGVGANGAAIESRDVARTPKAGAASLNTAVDASRATVTVSSFDVPVLLGVEYTMYEWLKLRAVGQRNLVGRTRVVAVADEDTDADGTMDTHSGVTEESHNIHDWLLRFGVGLSNDRIGWDLLFNLQPSPADYASPFFTAPRKATWRDPSITTAVVYKW